MPGLDPGIHVFLAEPLSWMAGTSPAMTWLIVLASDFFRPEACSGRPLRIRRGMERRRRAILMLRVSVPGDAAPHGAPSWSGRGPWIEPSAQPRAALPKAGLLVAGFPSRLPAERS